MLRYIFYFVLLANVLYSVEVDPTLLRKIIKENPNAYKDKLILARYDIEHHNQQEASRLIQSVLDYDKTNKEAIKLQEYLAEQLGYKDIFTAHGLHKPLDKKNVQYVLNDLYKKNQYQEYKKLFNAVKNKKLHLDANYAIYLAYIYLWDGQYNNASKVLENVPEHNLDKMKILADVCYLGGKYECAVRRFEKLYRINHNRDDGVKLAYSYLFLGEYSKVKRIYEKLLASHKGSKSVQKLGMQIQKSEKERLQMVEEKYHQSPSYKSLLAYCNALYALDYKDKTLDVLHQFNAKNSTDKSLLLEAQYLSWEKKYNLAVPILNVLSQSGNMGAKLLLGKVYSWQNKPKEAKTYLNDVIKNAREKETLFEAKKALAFVYKWNKEKAKSKKLFSEIYSMHQDDKEISEALMELNGDYSSLITQYEKNNASIAPENMRRLSELYFQSNKADKAIEVLKQYVKESPKDLEATKNLALMLIDKKDYYPGFGYLEYYAAKKNDANSSFILAQNYYWHGYNKESLEVLDTILDEYPNHKEANDLRAIILKEAPRYTNNKESHAVNDYFQEVGLKQLEVADSLYFNGHHAASLMYYENYLSEEPTNYNVRLRYAFALENAGYYTKAEGEFYLMFWSNKSDEVKYHYGYNLMKNHKYDKAKEVFDNLKSHTFRNIDSKLKYFLDGWKHVWESQNYEKYAPYYTRDLRNDDVWSLSKQQSLKNASFISVGIYDPIFKQDDKQNHYKLKFYAEIATDQETKKGNMILEIVCNTSKQECQIVNEKFIPGQYEKFVSYLPLVNQRLQDIVYLRKHPHAEKTIKSKKKTLNTRVLSYNTPWEKSKKSPPSEAKILEKVGLHALSVESYLAMPHLGKYPKNVPKNIVAKGYYFSDSDDILFYSVKSGMTHIPLSKSLYADINFGYFYTQEKNIVSYSGVLSEVIVHYNHFGLGLAYQKYTNFSEVVPLLSYHDRYKNHSFQVKYRYQNAIFYTHRPAVLEKRIKAHHYEISDYSTYGKQVSLWWNVTLNDMSNNDLSWIAQFDWRFFYDTLFHKKISYDIALEGWYTGHSKITDLYYSPQFADSTLLRFDPNYKINPHMQLKGMLGAGYSFSDNTTPYKIGLKIVGDPYKNMLYEMGCLYSNSIRGTSASTYNYLECQFSLGYTW